MVAPCGLQKRICFSAEGSAKGNYPVSWLVLNISLGDISAPFLSRAHSPLRVLPSFDAVVSADLFERLKPSPDIFLAASKALGVPPSQCVVIEDALAGVQAARAAGMR